MRRKVQEVNQGRDQRNCLRGLGKKKKATGKSDLSKTMLTRSRSSKAKPARGKVGSRPRKKDWKKTGG